MKKEASVTIFRMIALSEGVSFLLLLLIAMPLKYLFNMPAAVRIFGMIHGVLFIAFIFFAAYVTIKLKRNAAWFLTAFISSIVPLGAFYMEKKLRKEGVS